MLVGTQVNELISRHEGIFSAGELASIASIRENLEAAITWSNENFATVDEWLRDNYGNGAVAIQSSLVLLASVIVAMFYN